MTARDLRTGKQQSIEVKPTYGLTDDEVERMLIDSMESAESDFEARMLIDARNDADIVVRATDKAMKRAVDYLSPEKLKSFARRKTNCSALITGKTRHSSAIRSRSLIRQRRNLPSPS